MNIETYISNILFLYTGLFLLSIFIGLVGIGIRIWKKTLKYWWIIPYSMLYLFSAIFSTFIASMAYDDLADPNYWRYENWELCDFVLNDIKRLIIWLFIGVLLYLVFEREGYKKSIKERCTALLISLTIMLVTIIVLFITKIS